MLASFLVVLPSTFRRLLQAPRRMYIEAIQSFVDKGHLTMCNVLNT